MLKRIHYLILKSFLMPLLLAFIISMVVLLLQFLWKYVDDMVGKGLDNMVLVELMMYAAASLIPLALPISVLFASLMTFGNLGEHYELLAIKAAGVSLLKAMKSVAVVVTLVMVFAFMFSNFVLPIVNLNLGSLLYDISRKRPDLNITPGTFNNDIEGYTLNVGRKNFETNMLYNFVIYDHSKRNGNTSVTISDSAYLVVSPDRKYMLIHMYKGSSYEEISEDRNVYFKEYPFNRSYFNYQRFVFEMKGFDFDRTNIDLFKDNYHMLSLNQLDYAADSLIKVYYERRSTYADNMVSSNLFKREAQVIDNDSSYTKKIWKIIPTDSMVQINIDSLYKGYTVTVQERITQIALNYGKAAESFVQSSEQDLSGRMRWINNHKVEWHNKFTLSLACFLFFIIGAPLGAIIRRGGIGMPVVISVILFILYYVLSLLGKKLVSEAVIPAWEGMWMSLAIFLPIGLFLAYKAIHDSALLNIDSYYDRIKKIIERL